MSQFIGTWQQLRLFLRLNRVLLVLCPMLFAGLLWAMSDSLNALYPTSADRIQYAALNEASPVLKALNGPGHGLDTKGGILVFEVGAYLLLIAAIVAALTVVRHTRKEEESGRSELTGSVPSGRLAALTASQLGVTLLAVLTGAGCTWVMMVVGLPTVGSINYGAGVLAIMVLFGSVAGITAQVTVRAATASGLAMTAVGVMYALRAAGDVGDGGLSWASPFGWVQAARPFAQERLWPLGLTIAAAATLTTIGAGLRMFRDEGAGLFPSRPGPAEAAPSMSSVWAVRRRQTRGPLLGFGLLIVFLAAVFGVAGEDVTKVFESSSGLDMLLGMDEVGARDAYFSMVITLLMMLISAFGISAMNRLRADEHSGLAELELSTSTRRLPWVASAFLWALAGCLVLGVTAGLALGGSYTAVSVEDAPLSVLVRATLAQLPAVAVLVSLTLALFGMLPRLLPGAWVALGACAVIGFLGSALRLDDLVLDVSPFTHVPQLPDLELDGAIWAVSAVAVVLAVVGIVGTLRRDL